MRDFFINSLERIVSVIIIVMAIGVVGVALVAMGSSDVGLPGGLFVLVAGAVWILVIGGMAYLGLGIYHNTRRTAEALEALVSQEQQKPTGTVFGSGRR